MNAGGVLNAASIDFSLNRDYSPRTTYPKALSKTKQNEITMRFSVFLFLLSFCALCAQAQYRFDGTYNGVLQGAPVVLTLRTEGSQLKGVAQDASGMGATEVSGNIENNTAKGILSEPVSGLSMDFTANMTNANTLAMTISLWGLAAVPVTFVRKENTPNSSTNTDAPISSNAPKQDTKANEFARIDHGITGVWSKSNVINSGGASFATETRFVLNTDGTFEYGATRSMGGGSDWSYDGSQWSAPQMTGKYYTEAGKIYVTHANGQAVPSSQQLLGTYSLNGTRLITTSTDQVREIWER